MLEEVTTRTAYPDVFVFISTANGMSKHRMVKELTFRVALPFLLSPSLVHSYSTEARIVVVPLNNGARGD
jgi:hypothetical protein